MTSEAVSLDAQAETKIGVIDIVEVLRRTKMGQPALVRLQREIQDVDRQEQQYVARFHRSRAYSSFAMNPRYQSLRKALHSIMPNIQIVAEVLAEKGGFDIVMVKGTPETVLTTLYSADAVDLTEEAIEELNRRFPDVP